MDVALHQHTTCSSLLTVEELVCSLGRSDILRFGSVGVFEPIKSGIALDAAVRTDLDCAEEILLQEPAAMRSKYLGTAAIWTRPLGLRTHISRFQQVDSDSCRKDARELSELQYSV